MAFVNLSLLFGTMLVAVPVVLHLVMRQKPKQLTFPALQFVRKRRESNRRTLRLRHWLLLLLRCLLIGLAALALARPSVSSSLFGNWVVIVTLAIVLLLVGVLLSVGLLTRQGVLALVGLGCVGLIVLAVLIVMVVGTLGRNDRVRIGDREAPVAAVVVLDSSPRMEYRHENRTRLQEGQQIADWIVRQLPADSKVSVLDSRSLTPVFAVDLAAAQKTLQRVRTTGAPRSLNRLLDTSLGLVRQTSLQRKEIYVVTDLSARAWDLDDAQRLRRSIEQAQDLVVYLIDVGVEAPRNTGVTSVRLSSEVLPEYAGLSVRATVFCVGEGGRREIELHVEDLDPTLPLVSNDKLVVPPTRLRGHRVLELAAGAAEDVEFTLPELGLGTRHAEIRLAGMDALTADDACHFTVVVREAWLVLIVAPRGVDTAGFVEAIAPYEHRLEKRSHYDCLVITPEEIPNRRLEDYAAVVLLDPTPLPAESWRQVGSYVRNGGQLAMFLGHHAESAQVFNSPDAVALLPGKLGRPYRVAGRDVYLAPHAYDHPILREFRAVASSVPWNRFPVFRYWSLRDLLPDQQVVLRFGDEQPALLERKVDRGNVLTMTTPITELDRPAGRQAWNELAGPDDWPRFVLVNQIVRYLTQHDADRFNYDAGQRVEISSDDGPAPARYLLFTPDGEVQPVQARDGKVAIAATDNPGTYRLKGVEGGPVARGFSVNLPADATRLDRLTTNQLDGLLGPGQYQLARQRDQIVRAQGRQRAGREFYPFLISLVGAMLVMEHLLANRFYRDNGPGA